MLTFLSVCFHGGRVRWLSFADYLQRHKQLQLSKELSGTQKTAWFILHRIREAFGLTAIPLSGVMEIDEIYIGGKESDKHTNKKLKDGCGAVSKNCYYWCA